MKNIIIILLALLSFNTWADCHPLIAGQNIEMGSVCVENTETDITATYQADSGWQIDQIHLWIGSSLDDIPATRKENPKVGKFPYKAEVFSNSYTITIPLSNLGLVCFDNIYVGAHAVVSGLAGSGNTKETAWSDGETVNGNNWALISQDSIKCIPDCEEGYEANPETYTCDIICTDPQFRDPATNTCTCPEGYSINGNSCDIICPENQLRDPTTNTCYSPCPSDQIYDPSTNACNCPEGQELNPDTGYCEDIPVISGCETAFALGQITFIDAGLGSERWGWIVEIPSESMEGNTPIYAGAGSNDLSKGILVGTLHYLKLNNKRMKVRYELDQPYILQETHLYVDNSIPTTSAPGQYGFQHTDLSTSEDTYTVKVHTLQDIYLIGHGVSCTLE